MAFVMPRQGNWSRAEQMRRSMIGALKTWENNYDSGRADVRLKRWSFSDDPKWGTLTAH